MSAADFLFAPEVQKLLMLVYADTTPRPAAELGKKAKLSEEDINRTLDHLVASGVLTKHKAVDDQDETYSADTAFVFYGELRSIAFKSFAAAEPIRAMLRSKFKDSVVQAFVLGEDSAGVIEVVVVHGQKLPDEAEMTAAMQKLSKAIARNLSVHVVSHAKLSKGQVREGWTSKLASNSAIEIIKLGDTKAAMPAERSGLLHSARKTLAKFAR